VSAANMGVKAALSLLPFRNGAEDHAHRSLEQLLWSLKPKPNERDVGVIAAGLRNFSAAMQAGIPVLSGAACAVGLRSRLIRMDSPMMQAVVKDEARRALGALDQFGQAGFFKEWPSAQRELQ
jgi:hypothetical protein